MAGVALLLGAYFVQEIYALHGHVISGGLLLCGIAFGFGMLLAGGCGSGTIWQAAEGQVKLMVALAAFAMSTSLTKTLIRSAEGFRTLVGQRVFLPDLLGYPLTMFYVFMVMSALYLAVTWNEESEYFVVQM